MKQEINKYDIIAKYANQFLEIIESISINQYQVALKFVIEESKTAKNWEIPYIHGRINQWDINISSLDKSNNSFIKDKFKKICLHDLLDNVTADMAIKFDDYDLAAIMRIRIVEQILFYYKLSSRDLSKHREKTIDLFTKVAKINYIKTLKTYYV